jgi:hypothetical protein
MPRPTRQPRRPPSQTWKTFLRNHLAGTIAIDFLTVPTVTFNIVYVFFVLSLERRRVLHVNVTAHPYAAWTAQQIVEAIGADFVPAYLRSLLRQIDPNTSALCAGDSFGSCARREDRPVPVG